MANLKHLAEVLEKSAAYIGELERRNADLQAKIDSMEVELEKAAEERDSGIISALKDRGFSDHEIANLRALPKETIEKVASVADAAWDFGSAAGKSSTANLDPILNFVLN